MKFKFTHFNFNVANLERSLAFYDAALELKESRRITDPEGRFIIVYLTDGQSDFQLELTYLSDVTEGYDLGDNEFHLAFTVPDFEAARAKHQAMNCICFENLEMGIYFINDPDGYWLEILPEKF